MANYVKFRRGTPQAYANLAPNYDVDTLYFICEADADDGLLYLGSKLISGGEIGDFSIGDLQDIIVDAVGDKQLLVYDDSVHAWVNANYSDVIDCFVGATKDSSGVAGLVPAPEKGKTNLFLRSDGNWAEIEIGNVGNANVFSVKNDTKEAHATLIAQATDSIELVVGDIFIVEDLIYDNKYQHTAYVYNGSAWTAMDGNYDANNVYFSEDFIFTENIGTVEIPDSGSATVEAKGLNVKQFLSSLFAEEKNPSVTAPSGSIAYSMSTTTYEVGKTCTPKYKITFDDGNYEFGPETAVTATYVVTDTNGNNSSNLIDTFETFTVEDDTNYRISAVISHSNGEIPVTNLGKPYADGQIKAATLNTVYTSYVKGYRKTFYGTLTEKKESLTSDDIRGLTKSSSSALSNGSNFTINVPVGTLRVVIAYPASLRDLTSVLDKNDSNSNIVSGFGSPTTVQVEGADDFAAIDYKVYIMDFANPYDAANVFTVTI